MIYKYKIINPITNRKKPHIDKYGAFIVPNINHFYNYYIECINYNTTISEEEYILLLSQNKFDEQCRKCRVDDYGRLKIVVHGELKDYIVNECNTRGNVDFEYIESESNYDVWKVK